MCGVNRIGDNSRLFSDVLNILKSKQFCLVLSAVRTRLQVNTVVTNWKLDREKTKLSSHRISRLDKTVSKFSDDNSLVSSSVHTADTDKTRKDLSVTPVSVV